MGMESLDGAYAAAEGMYTIDVRDLAGPKFVLVSYASASPEIKSKSLSDRVDLTNYAFDKLVVFPFADYILFACRTLDSTVNNRTFAYHRIYGTFDLFDYFISKADIFNDSLIAGDPLTNNVQTLFNSYSSNDAITQNFWKSGISKLGKLTPRGKRVILKQLKKCKKFFIEGDIGPDQVLHAFVSLDRGPFIELLDEEGNPIIQGSGAYVDKTKAITIGSQMLGAKTLGGGGVAVPAYHYERSIRFRQDKFVDIQLMLQCSNVGYCSVVNLEFRDIRVLQNKTARKYRIT